MQLSRSTQFTLEGLGVLSISPNDHVATGGEGSIYRKAGTVIKLYTDAGKMERDGMSGKIGRLARLNHPFIVGPKGLVLGNKGQAVGYYMNWAEGQPLSRVFTNDFRQREGITDKHAAQLVEHMRDVTRFAHDHATFMVDPNELNWLAVLGGKTPEPRALDVDSWVIEGNIPATVPKMPSIRDWHSPLVSRESDWFAWAAVTFQVFTGIHPYKGGLDGYKPSEMERRMKDKASVFTSGIRLNQAVRPFDCIPAKLRMWYEAAFQQGERSIPPSPFDTTTVLPKAAKVKRVATTVTGTLVYDQLYRAPTSQDHAVRIFSCGLVLLGSGKLYDLDSKRIVGAVSSSTCEVVRVEGYWLIADKKNGTWVFSCINANSLNSTDLTVTLQGHQAVTQGNRMFMVTDQGLMELKLMFFAKPTLSTGQTWGAMLNSTHWFEGVGIQQGLGATFVFVPFSDSACAQVRVKELDRLTPVSAKAGNRFVTVMCVDRNGEYQKFELSFSADYKTYTLWQGEAESPELNLAILPKGVMATIVQDTKLHLFVPSNGSLKTVEDTGISTKMALGNWGDKVVYILDGNVWSVRMK